MCSQKLRISLHPQITYSTSQLHTLTLISFHVCIYLPSSISTVGYPNKYDAFYNLLSAMSPPSFFTMDPGNILQKKKKSETFSWIYFFVTSSHVIHANFIALCSRTYTYQIWHPLKPKVKLKFYMSQYVFLGCRLEAKWL